MKLWIVKTLITSCLFALVDVLYRYFRVGKLERVGWLASSWSLRPALVGATIWIIILIGQGRPVWQVVLSGAIWIGMAGLTEWLLRRCPWPFAR